MKRIWPTIIVAGVFIIDRVLKTLVLAGRSWDLHLFRVELFRNPGLVFSLPAPYWLAVTLMLIALGLVGLALWRVRREIGLLWPLLLLIVGAVSNIYDRLINGFIVDYLYFTDWLPIINLADVMLTAAVIIFLINVRMFDKKRPVI